MGGAAARCFIASRGSPALSGERREAQAQPERFQQAVERIPRRPIARITFPSASRIQSFAAMTYNRFAVAR